MNGTIYSHLQKKDKKQSIINVDNLDDYFECIKFFALSNNFIFRGINCSKQILPKIIREEDYSKNEVSLLKEFEKIYLLYDKVDSCWDFVSLAQHNGLFTRLVDFTCNIFVATFFALHNKKESDCDKYQVFVANTNDYSLPQENREIAALLKGKQYNSYAEEYKDNVLRLTNLNAIILNPKYSNERIFQQQGLFLLPINLFGESIKTLFSKMPYVIEINDCAREAILKYLDKNGFNEYKLMPGLDNACTEINNLCKNRL